MSGVSAGLTGGADLLAGDEFAGDAEVRGSAGVLTSAAGSLFSGFAVGGASLAAGCAAGCELGTGMDAAGFGGAGWALLGVAVDGVETAGT